MRATLSFPMSAPASSELRFRSPVTKSDLRCHASEDSPSLLSSPAALPLLSLSLSSAEIIQRCQHFGVNVGPQKSYWILHCGAAADHLTD